MVRINLRRYAFAAGLVAALAVASPASAATTITFTGSSATDGADGNIRSFSNGSFSVQASAWSYEGTTLETAWLGRFSSGLGVTNNSEGNGSSNNSHTIDNLGQSDFVLLVFNQAVNISSAQLVPFDISATANDNDARVSYTSFAGAFTPIPTAFTTGSSFWASLASASYNVSGNMTSPYGTSLNSAGKFGNIWLIGAASPNPDYRDDGFKLKSITVSTPAVPEPSTWAMMLLGFGLAGASLRRRNVRAVPGTARTLADSQFDRRAC